MLQLLRSEWTLVRKDGSAWISLLLFLVVCTVSVQNGLAWWETQRGAANRAIALDAQSLNEARTLEGELSRSSRTLPAYQDPRNAGALGRYILKRYAVMPLTPWAALERGQADLDPAYVLVTTETRQSFLLQKELNNPQRLLHGPFDLGFVIVALFPLVIIVLGFSLLSSESGPSLQYLICSQPLRLSRLMMVKVVVRGSLLFAVAAGTTLSGAFWAGALEGAHNLMVALAWLALVGLYGAFWLACCLLCNTLGSSSAGNALGLCTLWITWLLVLPAALGWANALLFPLPSRVAFLDAYRQASMQANDERGHLMARYYEDHPELAGGTQADVNDYYARRMILDKKLESQLQPLESEFALQASAQLELTARLSFLSPALVAQAAWEDIAGTDQAVFRDFSDQTLAFHERYRDFFQPFVLGHRSLARWEDIPVFHYRNYAGRWGKACLAFLYFAGLDAGLFAWAGYRLNRFSPVSATR